MRLRSRFGFSWTRRERRNALSVGREQERGETRKRRMSQLRRREKEVTGKEGAWNRRREERGEGELERT